MWPIGVFVDFFNVEISSYKLQTVDAVAVDFEFDERANFGVLQHVIVAISF
jgi:hypothetical protein